MTAEIYGRIWLSLRCRTKHRLGIQLATPFTPVQLCFPFFIPFHTWLEQSRQLYPIRTSTALQCTSPKPRKKYDTAVCNNTIYRAFNYSTAIIKVLLFEPGASIYTSVPIAVPPGLSYGPHPAHRSLGLTSSEVHNASVSEPGILIATISHLIKNTQLFHNDL